MDLGAEPDVSQGNGGTTGSEETSTPDDQDLASHMEGLTFTAQSEPTQSVQCLPAAISDSAGQSGNGILTVAWDGTHGPVPKLCQAENDRLLIEVFGRKFGYYHHSIRKQLYDMAMCVKQHVEMDWEVCSGSQFQCMRSAWYKMDPRTPGRKRPKRWKRQRYACKDCTLHRVACIIDSNGVYEPLPLEPSLRVGVEYHEAEYFVAPLDYPDKLIRKVFNHWRRMEMIRFRKYRRINSDKVDSLASTPSPPSTPPSTPESPVTPLMNDGYGAHFSVG